MRTSLRVFAAALSTLIAAAFLVAVPFVSPAHAVAGLHVINIGSISTSETNADHVVQVPVTLNFSPIPGENISANFKTVDISATGGSDYTAVGGQTLTWAFGESQTKNLPVTIKGDGFREPDEQLAVTFDGAVTGADKGTNGIVTITNDEAGAIPTLTVSILPADQSAPEDTPNGTDTVRNLTITLADKDPGQDVKVNYATLDGTATSLPANGTPDFSPAATVTTPLTFNADGAKVIPITIEGDTLAEPNEAFQVIFGGNQNAALAAGANKTLTLTNNDGAAPVVSVGDVAAVTEGDSGTKVLNVPITLTPAATQPTSVEVNTSDGSAIASTQDTTGDYVPVVKQMVTFGAGQTTKDVPVTLNGDIAQEPDETFAVTISSPNNASLGTPSKNATIQNDDFGQITTGVGPGGGPHVRTFGAAGADLGGFFAYEAAFTGGVHVARGDFFKADGSVGADGVDEIVTAPNKQSKPLVRIFALDGTIRASFFAYDQTFVGGVYVAAGNFDGDTSNGDELVVAAGPGGGPHVKVLQIKGPGDNVLDISNGGFYAYDPNFHGGVRLAAANLLGDAKDEIITGAGPGGGPHVRIFGLDGNNSYGPKGGFFAYDTTFTGGVFVAAAAGKIVTGAGPGGGPHVRVWNGDGSAQGTGFYAYGPEFHGGVAVAMGNLDNDPASEIVTGPGAGGGPHVRAFNQDGSEPFGTGFFAYQNFTGGVEVSIGGGGN